MREEVFRSVGVLVYVFDVESRGLCIPERKRKGRRRSSENVEHENGMTRRKSSHSPPDTEQASDSDSERDYDISELLSGYGGEDLRTFSDIITALRDHSPTARIFALVHKMDLVANSLREYVFREREAAIQRIVSHIYIHHPIRSRPQMPKRKDLRLTVLPTSIWDPSLYLAWGKLTSLLLPHLPLLESYLHHLSNSLPRCEEILLFEAATWLNVLAITTPLGKGNPELGRSERISAVVRGFRKGGIAALGSGSPYSSSPTDAMDDLRMGGGGAALQKGNFDSLQLKTPKFNLRMGRLTDDSYVVIIFGPGEGEMGCAGINLGVGRGVTEEIEGSAGRRRERLERRKGAGGKVEG